MKSEEVFSESEGNAWFRRNPVTPFPSPLHRDIAESLRQYLHEDEAILEIGASDGRFLESLRKVSPSSCSFTGIDPSKEAILSGRNSYPLLRLEEAVASSFRFDHKFDLIIFGFCLYLMSSSEVFQSLANAERHLNEGGFLSIVDFDPYYPHQRTYKHDERITTRKIDYSRYFSGQSGFHLLRKETFPVNSSNIRDGENRIALSVFIRIPDDDLPTAD